MMMAGGQGEWKVKTVTIQTKRTSTRTIADDMIAAVPTFSVAFAVLNYDYSALPTSGSNCVALTGINGNYWSGTRANNGSYTYSAISQNYGSGIAEVGDSYTIIYK